ncbi:MAG TPA: protein kinase [Ktedonobacteraceae bacterium]|nr:protein kinase [Ktedonobacteraceae bacterium]
MIRGQHLIGKVLGSCVLERLLGYGGSSAVFLAHQHNPERKVAVKVFLPRTSMDIQLQRDFYRRFLREAEAASKLDHPNILPIYSYGEQDGLPYIVMPYMPGGTLSEYMAKRGPLSLQEAQWYLKQIAAALDYAHTHGCVHCDVKPANILLDSDGHVMLSDFGIAHVMQSSDGPTQPLTKSPEALMGTPDYISPEQALGQTLDGRSDIYSLGITLFYLLAKQLPFKADSTIALALLHIHEPPPSLALIRADITPEIDRVVQKALAKEPDDRFQTAGEFSATFTQAVERTEVVDPLPSSGKRMMPIGGAGRGRGELTPLPRVSVKPMKASSSRLARLVRLCIVILVLSLAGAFGASVLVPRITRVGSKTPTVIPTSTGNTLENLLINRDLWPSSDTYFYIQQQYHIKNASKCCVALALYANHTFGSFRLTVTMQEIQSSHDTADYYGVIFRASADQSRYYVFEVDTNDGGQYVFWRYDGPQWRTIKAGPAPMLLTASGKSNTMTVEARGNTFTFFINGKLIDKTMVDSLQPSLTSGEIGLYVEEQAEVAFSNLHVEALK